MENAEAVRPKSYPKEDKVMTVMQSHLDGTSGTSCARFIKLMQDVRNVSLSGNKADLSSIIANLQCAEVDSSQYSDEQICLLLCETAFCFEQFDMSEQALSLALRAVNVSSRCRQETWFLRKAHNTAAICHMRLCNFTDSIHHLSRSFELAIVLNDDVAKLSALCNAVCLLDAMDLNSEALKLSLQIRNEKATGPAVSSIRFQNAVNGGRLAVGAGDSAALSLFVHDGRECVRSSTALADVHLAQHWANRAVLLAWTGNEQRAYDALKRLLRRAARLQNSHINAIIIWGIVVCAAKLSTKKEVAFARAKARQMMKVHATSSFFYEDLVLALLPLCERLATKRRDNIVEALVTRLKRYHIATKHARFFARPNPAPLELSPQSLGRLENPVYEWPRPLWSPGNHYPTGDRHLVSDNPNSKDVSDDLHGLRTERFETAENWAVAAEWSAGISVGFCFKVGRVAALIAARVGWGVEECASLELACRLHDVGSVLVDPKIVKAVAAGNLDSDCIGREHTWAGHYLLSGTDNALLNLASKIALSHREWYNGCGYPRGLAGDLIPLEARICAVAREYCALFDTFGGLKQGHLRAVAQCRTMAGVQLDPDLVSLLIEMSSSALTAASRSHGFGIRSNGLFRAKVRLSEVLSKALTEPAGLSA